MILNLFPKRLFVPLATDYQLCVHQGQSVLAGQTIAKCTLSADILAPANGIVGDVKLFPLVDSLQTSSPCLEIHSLSYPSSISLEVKKEWTLVQKLKKGGIVGLGGGGFPAWRKWRHNLKYCIINALESDQLAQNDMTLLESFSFDTFINFMTQVGDFFAPETLLALREDCFPHQTHPLLHRFSAKDYVLGNERVLIRNLLHQSIENQHPPSDYGIVCFNVSTAVAIYQLLCHQVPMTSRTITLHHQSSISNVCIPFGTPIADIRAFLNINTTTPAYFSSQNQVLDNTAIVSAETTVIRFSSEEIKKPQPCIHCVACVPVCPTKLIPWKLYQLAVDQQELTSHRLDDCLFCRRCDEVCPSAIPLSDTFLTEKKKLQTTRKEKNKRLDWYNRYQHHLSRKKNNSVAPPNWSASELLKKARIKDQ